MNRRAARVLERRNGLFVVDKPPGVPTEPTEGFASSLVHEIAVAEGLNPEELHAATRLDVGVSGLLVLAAGKSARRRLAAMVERRSYRRGYLALALPPPEASVGEWTGPIGRGASGLWKVEGTKARPAITAYRVLATTPPLDAEAGATAPVALMELSPRTGRTHQLRVHAAHAGSPLLGDRRYGGARRLTGRDGSIVAIERVALHSAWICLEASSEVLRVESPPPDDFTRWWRALGGDPPALARGTQSCEDPLA